MMIRMVVARLFALAVIICVYACSSDTAAMSTARGRSSVANAGSPASAGDPLVLVTSNDPSAVIPANAASGRPLEHCDPGAYEGNYACKLVMQGMPTDTPIEGVVSFFLEVNSAETKQSCPPGVEFCDFDLVIKEGSGKLFGFVLGFVGFETGLKGGLDCRSGKFHADAVGGIYGIPWEDPDNAGQLKVGAELGTFDGTLDGLHSGQIPQVISGMWNLGEPSVDVYCPGPFSVQLTRT